MQTKRYIPEFRIEAVKLVLAQGLSYWRYSLQVSVVPETGLEPVRLLSGKRRILGPKINTSNSSTCRRIRSTTGFLQCPSTPLAVMPGCAFADLETLRSSAPKKRPELICTVTTEKQHSPRF